jgi:hypothetical protein
MERINGSDLQGTEPAGHGWEREDQFSFFYAVHPAGKITVSGFYVIGTVNRTGPLQTMKIPYPGDKLITTDEIFPLCEPKDQKIISFPNPVIGMVRLKENLS